MHQSLIQPAHDADMLIPVADEAFIADHAGALFHEGERALLVADLHLEKASHFAMRGQMLPPYDTATTLAALMRVVARRRPRAIHLLGDSFHDRHVGLRLTGDTREALAALGQGRDLVWITGNHDPDLPEGLPGEVMAEGRIGGVALRHIPSPTATPGPEIAGHLHPVAKVVTDRGRLRRRCFVGCGERLVMPAFGALAGGLNLRDQAIMRLFAIRPITAWVMGSTRVYPIGENRLAPD
jgi:uncharacterized protein